MSRATTGVLTGGGVPAAGAYERAVQDFSKAVQVQFAGSRAAALRVCSDLLRDARAASWSRGALRRGRAWASASACWAKPWRRCRPSQRRRGWTLRCWSGTARRTRAPNTAPSSDCPVDATRSRARLAQCHNDSGDHERAEVRPSTRTLAVICCVCAGSLPGGARPRPGLHAGAGTAQRGQRTARKPAGRAG
jgi:hypothetical protein